MTLIYNILELKVHFRNPKTCFRGDPDTQGGSTKLTVSEVIRLLQEKDRDGGDKESQRQTPGT